MARYEAGETLASIARTYDCSPPAISYVVSRSRAQGAMPTAAAPSSPTPPEPQLVKSHATEASVRGPALGAAIGTEQPASNPAPDPPRVVGISLASSFAGVTFQRGRVAAAAKCA